MTTERATLLPRSFYARPANVVAPALLNKLFMVGRAGGRIVEVEAYTADDPASHSFRGPTLRNRTMFGPPGHLYVYFTYGMHFCANVVTGAEGVGEAVLIRAIEPLWELDEMRIRRGEAAKRDVDLTNGPGKLTRALGIGRHNDGDDLTESRIRIYDDGTAPRCSPTSHHGSGSPTASTGAGVTSSAATPRSPVRRELPPPSKATRRRAERTGHACQSTQRPCGCISARRVTLRRPRL